MHRLLARTMMTTTSRVTAAAAVASSSSSSSTRTTPRATIAGNGTRHRRSSTHGHRHHRRRSPSPALRPRGSSSRLASSSSSSSSSSSDVVEPGPPPPIALVSFTRGGSASGASSAVEVGLVENGAWIWPIPRDAYGVSERGCGMQALVAAWHAMDASAKSPAAVLERERRGDPIPLSAATLLAPLPSPPSVICVGKNYMGASSSHWSSYDRVGVVNAVP
ncbi:uncharacterized protein MICPUCDRAFT_59765 [Micromonas pusilla CCMP1545]|uniref:Predicted protein n=1 Tax=Micromonas pusilla (strain CCMP1545) TaxID=564608 RepID=C1MWH1_MICPC|nr:uncharacterized protein MICPUCDRAFT_59765 [Micromonas pusilla CCMP1545]EEH55876.1 predicted protein [Micromonas pusilla CCMP1545]|eukprot:XP_003059924.1 predicted protein [Micromonas pusilla CCMP1545]